MPTKLSSSRSWIRSRSCWRSFDMKKSDVGLDRSQRRLRRGQTRHWHAEWRTAHVVKTDLMTEDDRLRVAAVFTADTDFQSRFRLAATLGTHADKLSDAVRVEHLERIVADDFSFDVSRQKAARVVAAQAKRGLREIVSAKREEVGVRRDAIGHERGARQFDHRADLVVDGHSVFAHHLTRDFFDQLALLPQLFADGHERHHDLEFNLAAFALHLARCFEDRATLHSGNFGKHKPEAATAEPEHRIGFANAIHLAQQRALVIDLVQKVVHLTQRRRALEFHLQLRQLTGEFFRIWQKLVQRRIQQTDRHGQPDHFTKDRNEIAALQR